jgi:hypothetical protein
MKLSKRINPVTRAIGVFGAVAIVVGGVTYAVMQSQATLTNNTISSATASLQVDNTDDATNGFGTSDVGFQFTNLVPGAGYGDPQNFSLHNAGTSNLQVTVYATAGTVTGVLDKNKVHVKFTNTSLSTPGSVEYTLAQLEANFNGLPGVVGTDFLDTSTPGETNEFEVQVKLDEGATGASGASNSGFNLVFTGTAYTPEPIDL